MNALQTSLAQAGKLKQFCQAVLDVVGAVEQIGPLEQAIQETQARLIQHQQAEARVRAVLATTQASIDQTSADVAQMLASAKHVNDQSRREAEQAVAAMMADAKDAVRLSYDAKAKLDADVVVQQQNLARLRAETHAQEQKLIEAKAAIERMLR